MAKFKKAGKRTGAGNSQAQAEQLSRKLSESAQQIWLAGVGAFGRAQAEGTRLFEALVKEGVGVEQTVRKFAGGNAGQVRDAVQSTVGQARERATDTWDKLEKVFEDRVQRALVKLGVPGRDDLADLAGRVDGLTAELRRHRGNAGAPAAKKAAARKTSERKTSPAQTAKRTAKAAAKAARQRARKAS